MKRIGILLDSTFCSQYLHETVGELANSDRIELFYLLNSNAASSQPRLWHTAKAKIKAKGPSRFLELAFFKLLVGIEFKILSAFFQDVKAHSELLDIAEFSKNDYTYLHPRLSRSGLLVHYPVEDLKAIESLHLDLIVRGNAPGIFKGEILSSAKDGIVSFHHGDNRWNRGGPPGFWEVYLRKPSTGFVVQILTEDLDGGAVIFRGDVATARTYAENLTKLYRESNPYLAKIILDYAATDYLAASESKTPYGGSILKAPSFAQSLSYILRTGSLLVTTAVSRIVFRKRLRWGVAFVASSWRDAKLRKGVEIRNPPNRFLADPFLVERNGRTICFVEDYSYPLRKGCISAVEIVDDNQYEILGPVIEESFHMSFPFLFEHGQELYMVPETAGAESIRLYRCREFPMTWDFQRELVSNIHAADSMVFEFDERWWLLTNTAVRRGADFCSRLTAYYSDDPISGEWIPHDGNPLLVDSNIARNGGILDLESRLPVRCRQKQGFNAYGASLSVAVITDLTPSSFSESEIGEVVPKFFPGLKGCHHIHSNDRYTVYDYVRRETLK